MALTFTISYPISGTVNKLAINLIIFINASRSDLMEKKYLNILVLI